MGTSKIEWTEQTWNPIIGCSIVSPGCTNCYAMKMAARTEAMGISRYDGMTRKVNGNAVWTGKLARAPRDTLLAPLKRRKPTTYFVNSMGDLFHEDCPDEWIDEVFAVMALSPQHTFQVLTKRAERMREFVTRLHRAVTKYQAAQDNVDLDGPDIVDDFPHVATSLAHPQMDRVLWPLPNIWLGVSTERQTEANERVPHLLNTPAAVRFISAEPLLDSIDLTRICILPQRPGSIRAGIHINALKGKYCESGMTYMGDWDITKPAPDIPAVHLDWVIVGGESGPNARPMDPDCARFLRDQCFNADIPFFFKQWGEWADCEDWPSEMQEHLELINRANGSSVRVGKKCAGRKLDGALHDAMPPRNVPGTPPALG